VATLLASAPQLAPQARVFLEACAPRLRHILVSGLQSGHMAVLEEATVACRALALMAGSNCALAEALLAETAASALAFVVGSCLTERSSPSEVFMPISAMERLAAQVQLDSEATPAETPSIFHQRIEYLALELLRNVLVALLRVAASPTWLSNAPARSGPIGGVALATAPGVWPSTPSIFGLRSQMGNAAGLGIQDASCGPMRQWAAVMDAALEGARRVVDIMEALHRKQHSDFLLASGSRGVGENSLWVPLSLALAPLARLQSGAVEEGACPASPGALARGLAPPRSPRSLGAGASPLSSPHGRRRTPNSASQQGVRYQHMALRPLSSLGGQQALGIVPEYVSFGDIRKLCGSIVEMACTLLSDFCQATRSSILAGTERSAPGSSVLHGLLSFLHELRQTGSAAVDSSVVDVRYLDELDSALRSWQNLGTSENDGRALGDASWAAQD